MESVGRDLEASESAVRTKVACGVVAGPAFVVAFAALGATRAGYDWRREAVSSLANGRGGWAQRVNFILAGALYCVAAQGLAHSERGDVGPAVVSALVAGAGVGLIGSGVFVTDPANGSPASLPDRGAGSQPIELTWEGRLHNLFAIPIFAGVPAAALVCAGSGARRGQYRWAGYSAGSAIVMATAFGLFGAAFGGVPRLVSRAGVFQRVSIATGFGWLSALSLRALRRSHGA